jgi:hypothetical protein
MRLLLPALLVFTASACDSSSEGPGVADAATSVADAATSVDATVPSLSDAGPGPAVIGGGTACDLPLLARQLAESENTTPPFDCGTAVMADPLARWVAFSACLVDHLNAKAAFHGAFELDNSAKPDSIRAFAFVGIAGPTFVLKQIFWDSDPSGGAGVPARAQRHQCAAPTVRDACTAAPGRVCMGCGDQKNPDLVDLCPGWAAPGNP